MIADKSVLALIPARGGSKGVPGKNIRPAGGKPLIAWTIEAAKASRHVDRVVLSSDDPSIATVAKQFGCDVPFMRPAELATDEADSMDVVRHALKALPERYDYLVLLQPTSPLRRAADIDGALERCLQAAQDAQDGQGGAQTCVSVCEPDKSPYWMMTMAADGRVKPLFPPHQVPSRRQDAPPIFALNGAVYVAPTDHLAAGGAFVTAATVGYPMPKDRSFDIDTELDLRLADFLLTEGQR
jgi:CMP-N,N'-diacetyllegionaminic acid synthase